MDHSTLEKISQAIQDELGIDISSFDHDLDLRDSAILDSMQFIGLLSRVELAINKELPMSIMEVKTFREFISAVEIQLAD